MAKKPAGARPPGSKTGGRFASDDDALRVTVINPGREAGEDETTGKMLKKTEPEEIEVRIERARQRLRDGEGRLTHKTRTVYSAKIPPALRSRPFDMGKDDRQQVAETLARAVSNAALRDHPPSDSPNYKRQHYAAGFAGTMYEDTTRESKMDRAFVGTYHKTDPEIVVTDLIGRIEQVLGGETPRTNGPPEAYGYFSGGIEEVDFDVMEEVPFDEEDEDEADEMARTAARYAREHKTDHAREWAAAAAKARDLLDAASKLGDEVQSGRIELAEAMRRGDHARAKEIESVLYWSERDYSRAARAAIDATGEEYEARPARFKE